MSLLTWTLGGLGVVVCATVVAERGTTDLAMTMGLGCVGLLALLRIRNIAQTNHLAVPEFGGVQTIVTDETRLDRCSPTSIESKETS